MQIKNIYYYFVWNDTKNYKNAMIIYSVNDAGVE